MAGAAMPAEHAILGLLHLDDGSGHGYDLARNFADGQPLANVLRLETGMLYHHLKKMERQGWVASTTEQQPSRPARQVYHLTGDGLAELQRWLTEPVRHTREIRLEFLVKLYFAQRMDDALAARLIAGQFDALRTWLEALTELRASSAATDLSLSDRKFTRLVLDLRIAQTRAAIDWLGSADPGPNQ
jgi:PadR family transcriptional regulator, regulatory protein AphA